MKPNDEIYGDYQQKQPAVSGHVEPVVMCTVPPKWVTHYYLVAGEKVWVEKNGDNYTYINYGMKCSLHECYVKQLVELNT